MTTREQAFGTDDRLKIHCPWQGMSYEAVARCCQRLYRCSVETWLANREQWDREDAEASRRELYPTAEERISDDR